MTAGSAGSADGPDHAAVLAVPTDLPRVLGGSPSEDELAAVAAVLALLATERSAAVERLEPERTRSAWDRSARSLRAPDLAGRRWATSVRG